MDNTAMNNVKLSIYATTKAKEVKVQKALTFGAFNVLPVNKTTNSPNKVVVIVTSICCNPFPTLSRIPMPLSFETTAPVKNKACSNVAVEHTSNCKNHGTA